MNKIKRNILLNPGPATTTDSVKYAQVVPDICPREKEFGQLMKSVATDIKKIAWGDKDYTTVLFGGSGTAAMDSVINSVVPPNKKILIINNGAYGEGMVKIAKAYSMDFIDLKFNYDSIPAVNQIENVLLNDDQIACVSVVHHETTTGLLNPIREIGILVKKYNKTYIVDTISSFAGIPIDIKDNNIDFMMSTSNKCIQGMAGVCFIICNKKELDKTKNYPRISFYLNLYDQYEYFHKNYQMRFTPPVQTIYALRKAIDELFEEGIENRYIRYTKSWETLRKGLLEMGFNLLLNENIESHLLLTVLEPISSNYDFNKMHDLLYKMGFTIYPGKIGGMNTFRIANIGNIDYKDIKKFLEILKKYLKKSQINILVTK